MKTIKAGTSTKLLTSMSNQDLREPALFFLFTKFMLRRDIDRALRIIFPAEQ